MARPRQFTDDEILDGARRCFIEHGPGVSTNHHAQEIGVSQATLFKRIGTKQQLMVAALASRPATSVLGRLEAGPTDAPLREQLLGLARDMATMYDRVLPRVMTLWATGRNPIDLWPDPEQAPPVRARRALAAFFAEAQAHGRMGGGDPMLLAMVFIGGVKEAAFQRHMLRDTSPATDSDPYASNLVDTFWHGVQPLETP